MTSTKTYNDFCWDILNQIAYNENVYRAGSEQRCVLVKENDGCRNYSTEGTGQTWDEEWVGQVLFPKTEAENYFSICIIAIPTNESTDQLVRQSAETLRQKYGKLRCYVTCNTDFHNTGNILRKTCLLN